MRDFDELFDALAKSRFRRRFALGRQDRDYVAAKGMVTVLDHARALIGERLAPVTPRNDGKQTPMRGHSVFVAQRGDRALVEAPAAWRGRGRATALHLI